MASIHTYTISIPDDHIDKLTQKLALASFPDELDGVGWNYGAPLSEIKRLTEYWRNDFDWKKQEAQMNKLPNFRTSIEVDRFGSLDIHFIHQKSEIDTAIPLLFSHGWPGNFLEVTKLLPLLVGSGNDAPAFHVVAPSLPNFGFSEGVAKKGFGLAQYAETFHKLMQKLGYKKYVTQGGDWGCMITRIMGLLYPKNVLASHINMIVSSKPSWTSSPLLTLRNAFTPYTSRDHSGFNRRSWFVKEGRGYSGIQSTKPQTLGYALTDSPVGLLAWIYEKLHDWTDNYPWTEDEILTWVSLYWFSTAGPAASLRIYYEVAKSTSSTGRDRAIEWIPGVKLGLAHFPKEIYYSPKIWSRTLGPVVYESHNESGGHFAAWETPEAIARDLKTMFGKSGGAYGVLPGKDGYSRRTAN